MESYDQILIGSFYALPAFQKTFGFQTPDGSYQVSAPWQSALSEDSAFLSSTLVSSRLLRPIPSHSCHAMTVAGRVDSRRNI